MRLNQLMYPYIIHGSESVGPIHVFKVYVNHQDRDEEIEMEAGSQHILKYSAIEDLVREGAVRLI